MAQLIIKVLVIGAVSVILALLFHGSFIRQLNSGELILRADVESLQSEAASSEKPESKAPSLRTITLDEARQRFESKTGVFIDARLQPLYEYGHIPGAISFPRQDYEKDKNIEKIAHLKNEKVIIYCSGKDCQDSALLAGYLAKEGFLDIEVFEGGWPEWTAAGLASEEAN